MLLLDRFVSMRSTHGEMVPNRNFSFYCWFFFVLLRNAGNEAERGRSAGAEEAAQASDERLLLAEAVDAGRLVEAPQRRVSRLQRQAEVADAAALLVVGQAH